MLKRRHSPAYDRIVETVRLAAPFFGGFVIRDPLPDTVQLEWFEQTDPDTPFKAHVLSDGTLRFICLATLLLQPVHLLPDTVLIDEPELGLHPYAINLLADMLKQVAETKPVIDLYRLDNRFPGHATSIAQPDLGRRLAGLHLALHRDVVAAAACKPERFIPYIQPHEFEALLFSDVSALTQVETAWGQGSTWLAGGARVGGNTRAHQYPAPTTSPPPTWRAR